MTAVTANFMRLLRRQEPSARHELAFLPAALEIVETPPSPVGRATSATIVLFFCLALVWAAFGQVDIIASATGKIVSSGRDKLIQPFETGVVRAIRVHDGQSVKAGDVLIELDPTMTRAEQSHIRADLVAAQLDVARLRAALADGDDPQALFRAPALADADQIAMQRQFLAKEAEEYRAKLAALDRQRAEKEAEHAAVAATIAKLDALAPLIEQRVEILKTLSDKGLGSKLTYLEAMQGLTENRSERLVQQNHLKEADAALAAIIETRAHEAADLRRSHFSQLSEAERKAAGLSVDLVKAEERTKLQVLTAPADGVVQQLSIHTVGGVVTPAEQLAVVVPSDAALEIEAMISNRDIGFVHAGQDVQIKVDAFNFTRYGVLHGKVLDVSQDAISRDTNPATAKQKERGAEGTSSEPPNQELNYTARISLGQRQIIIDDNAAAALAPGMAVTVEIKTGTRSILSYLLSPLQKYHHDALRER